MAQTQKIFKSLDEQILILKQKGLIINNEETAKNILFRENYFFISGYRHVFLNEEKNYKTNTTFEELYSLFLFDRYFRNIIFKNLLIVENNFKSILSYVLSRKYGYKEREYLNPNNFTRSREKIRQVNDLIRKMKRQIRINANKHTATLHYLNNYGYVPLWVGVKVLSFGIMSELFSILKEEDQKEISEVYNVSINNLRDYFPILANYRNLCAHEDILFDHFTQKQIENLNYHRDLNIEENEEGYINGKNDLFALIIILKEVLTADEFKMMMNEISYELDRLSGNLKVVGIEEVLKRMGFPVNYKEIVYL